FIDAELLVSSQRQGTELVGPFARSSSWQAQADEGFDVTHFSVDWEARKATCPHGKQSRYWQTQRDAWGNTLIRIGFAKAHCQPCPSRSSCTRSKSERRTITVVPKENYEALCHARK